MKLSTFLSAFRRKRPVQELARIRIEADRAHYRQTAREMRERLGLPPLKALEN